MNRNGLLATSIALAAALAGCGSTSSGRSPTGQRAGRPSGSRPTQVYRVRLTGAAATPHGAPQGIGAAIIAFHGDTRVCWRFSHLHGFTDATSARVHVGTGGRLGNVALALSTGPRLRHRGCVRVNRTLTQKIWSDPSGYYVSIPSKQYPQGAVRAQL
jgi:CHRD domain